MASETARYEAEQACTDTYLQSSEPAGSAAHEIALVAFSEIQGRAESRSILKTQCNLPST
jgi:hypothetical protein